MVRQRDIVEVVFDADFGGNHPAIVLSNRLVQEVEGYFVCVMMTTRNYDDDFSFVITDEMLSQPLGVEYCEARCHLINFVPVDSIIPNAHNNQIKIGSFRDLIQRINDTTFSTGDLN